MRFSHREINEVTGNMEAWYWDDVSEAFTIQTTHYGVEDIIATNKRQQSSSLDKRFGKEMLHHVAEIPNGVIIKLKREHNIDIFSNDPDHMKRLKRLLDDPEYKYLKSTVRKLSKRKVS